ncbi:glycosyltransferase [Belnapia mucosa]|nr:glycosyltransferase [Belnapia mucosa]
MTARARGQLATLLVLALVGAIQGLAWWGWNRPVAPPDWHGPVGGLAFAPYQRGQGAEGQWPSAEEIAGDLRRVAPLTRRIRTYTVGGGFDRIPGLAAEAAPGLRVTLGAWLDGGPGDAAELARLTAASAAPNVDLLMVGNETVLRGDLTPAALIARLRTLRAAGPGRPLSTAEPWHVWLAHPDLAAAVDVVTIHLLPYWEGLPVEAALRFTLEKYRAVAARFPGKPILIGEVGWPSAGRDIGAARGSRLNQAGFVRGFLAAAGAGGLNYFLMEAFDQPWKVSFEGRAAGHWGLLDLDRQPKWPLAGPVQEVPDWPLWALGTGLASALLSGPLLARRPDIRLPGKLVLVGLAQGMVAGMAGVTLAMAGSYLDGLAAAVWLLLLLGQGLLLGLLLAEGFELAETVWAPLAPPPMPPARAPLPRLSIHLAICNEPPALVRQTLEALAALDYPEFEVLVVENNTADPALWQPVERLCARLGPRFRFLRLGPWPGFKAGALNAALRATAPEAELVGVIDADYVVAPDWARRMAPYFADPAIGFTQNPQDYRDGGENVFKRLLFWDYAGFFQAGMVTRAARNAIIQHGTMVLIRRSALEEAGGWAEWCICEDAELGLRLLRGGWRGIYVPESLGRGLMPDDFAAWCRQRQRWAHGAVQILRRHAGALANPRRSELTRGQRWHFATGWAAWLGDAMGFAMALLALAWSAGLILAPVRTEFPILLFLLPALGLFLVRLARVWAIYAARVPCGWSDRLGAMLAGLALAHGTGRTVLLALLGRRLPFRRTPKLVRAPALLAGLGMAWPEAALALGLGTAALGVALVHGLGTAEARLWCLLLLVQSLPGWAAVAMSLIAAWPARQARPSVRPSALRWWRRVRSSGDA